MQQPESNNHVLETCPAGTHAFCAVDLLANIHGKTTSLLLLLADVRDDVILPGSSIPQSIPASRLLRSSTDSSPLITALRV